MDRYISYLSERDTAKKTLGSFEPDKKTRMEEQ